MLGAVRCLSSATQIGRAVALRKFYQPNSDRRRVLNLIVHSTDAKDNNPFYDPAMKFDDTVEQILEFLLQEAAAPKK
jgi:hypothetical protein